MNKISWQESLPEVWEALRETLLMVSLSFVFVMAIGSALGVVLVVTAPGGILANRPVNVVLGTIVNIGRSLPFIILLVALIPLTRFLVGTAIGPLAAVVPLTIGCVPFFAAWWRAHCARWIEAASTRRTRWGQAVATSSCAYCFRVRVRHRRGSHSHAGRPGRLQCDGRGDRRRGAGRLRAPVRVPALQHPGTRRRRRGARRPHAGVHVTRRPDRAPDGAPTLVALVQRVGRERSQDAVLQDVLGHARERGAVGVQRDGAAASLIADVVDDVAREAADVAGSYE